MDLLLCKYGISSTFVFKVYTTNGEYYKVEIFLTNDGILEVMSNQISIDSVNCHMLQNVRLQNDLIIQ